MQNTQNKAFTLVELIVVITILAILGTIAFISLQGYSSQARDSRRISDIQNIKKSLELFTINTGKYPLPDNKQEVSYSGETLWYQGTIGDIVTTNLSRNLNKKPTDPLTEQEYTYSVINSQTQYELLSVYESDLVSYGSPSIRLKGRNLGWVTQTNAANTNYPKISGNYNGVFVKTSTYYIPTPSIINAELSGTGLVLNNDNIKSQIITGGDNNLLNGTIQSSTGGLTNFTLQTFSGTLDTTKGEDSNGAKEALANKLITAYSGTTLANNGVYKQIVETSGTNNLITLVDNIVLGLSIGNLNESLLFTIKTVLDCGITMGEILYGSSDGTSTNLVCSDNIIVCNGITGSGYTISACNLGSTIVGTDWNISGGSYFQWGNNSGMTSSTSTSSSQIDVSSYGPGNYYNNAIFIKGDSDWALSQNDNLWGNTTNTNDARQGPCPENYHIPTQSEWDGIISSGNGNLWDISGTITEGIDLSTFLKLPMVGYRRYTDAVMNSQGNIGLYWSSSSSSIYGYSLYFYDDNITTDNGGNRANGFTIRCFKN